MNNPESYSVPALLRAIDEAEESAAKDAHDGKPGPFEEVWIVPVTGATP